MSDGVFPFLIFSHGMGGSMYNQQYLAEFMARNGYIVAAVDHNDKSYTFQTLVDRPRDISNALDFILNDKQISTHIDNNKIGMLGHSLGGYTAFAIGGAVTDFSQHPTLCAPLFYNDYLCQSKISIFFKKIYVYLRGLQNHHNYYYDDRVKAIAVLAPGLGQVFEKQSLHKIKIPVLIMEAEKDEVVPSHHIALFKDNLANSPKYYLLEGAGHYAFLPISENDYIKKIAPEICYDPEIPRSILHAIIQQQVLFFFDSAF